MKIKKTISLENWVIQEILRRFPKARNNFSATIEGLLITSMNNPLAYWSNKAKHYNVMFQHAVKMKNHFEELERELKKNNQAIETRNEAIIKAIESPKNEF